MPLLLPHHRLLHVPPLSHHLLPTTTFLSTSSWPNQRKPLKATSSSSSSSSSSSPSSRPARDKVIDFGKYKGQMMGTIPPTYLRWLAEDLRGGDTAPWAALADDVLADPVYLDRIEWDHAHRFLSGDSKYQCEDDDDEPLHEIADRFGWDLNDRDGWSRLDLRLLGTSFGGRIPRKDDNSASAEAGAHNSFEARKKGRKVGLFSSIGNASAPRGKREERRERMRMKREEQVRTAKKEMLGLKEGEQTETVKKEKEMLGSRRKAQIGTSKKEILGLRGRNGGGGGGTSDEVFGKRETPGSGRPGNPFPGRESLLDKVRKLRG